MVCDDFNTRMNAKRFSVDPSSRVRYLSCLTPFRYDQVRGSHDYSYQSFRGESLYLSMALRLVCLPSMWLDSHVAIKPRYFTTMNVLVL